MSITAVLMQSFMAMSKIACIASVGIVGTFYPEGNPIFTPAFLKQLSIASYYIFLPALNLTSLGTGLSPEKMSRFWVLIPTAMLSCIVSYCIGCTLKPFAENDPRLFRAIVISASFPNIIALPLLVMQTMCESDIINHDYSKSADLCFKEAKAMMFVVRYRCFFFLCWIWSNTIPSVFYRLARVLLGSRVSAAHQYQCCQ